MAEVEVEAESDSFRVMSTSESPVKVKISEAFICAERANALSRCTAMVCNKSASPEVRSASHGYDSLHELIDVGVKVGKDRTCPSHVMC